MFRFTCFSLFLGVLGLLASCKKDARLPDTEFPDYNREFWAKGRLRNDATGVSAVFDVATGSSVVSNKVCRAHGFPYRWEVCSFTTANGGPACTFYLMGGAPTGERPVCPTFWTQTQIENYLQNWHTPQPVDSVANGLMLSLYYPNLALGSISHTSLGTHPNDYWKIESVEEFDWEAPNPARSLRGKKVRISFQVTLSGGFSIREGEAVLFVPYVL